MVKQYKYTPHSTERNRHEPIKPREPFAWLVALFAKIAIICIVVVTIGVPLALMISKPQQNVSIAAGHVDTLTPLQPETNTPRPVEPTAEPPTPYPTKTQVSAIAEKVVYVKKEVIKKVVVTQVVIITTTPEPTEKPTQSAAAIQDAHDAKMQRGYDVLWLVVAFLVVAFLAISGFAILFYWIFSPLFRRTKERVTTIEDVRERVDRSTQDIADLIDASIEVNGRTSKKILGWREMTDWTGERWDNAIRNLRESGYSISAQSGVGTVFVNMTLGEARLLIPLPSAISEQ